MKFWDTSAIMPLIAEEETSEAVSALFATDSDIVLSWFTPVEISSAIWRRWRETTEVLQRERAERVVSRLRESWYEVTDIHAVAQLAHEVLQRHRLKAADALQLASALAVANDRNLVPFVTLDGRLAAAAQGEGLTVIRPTTL